MELGDAAELPLDGVEPLTPEQAAKVFDRLDLAAEREVAIFITRPFAKLTGIHEADDPARQRPDGFARAPRRRLIYESGILEDRDVVTGLRNALTVNTEIRASASLPFKMILADRKHALMSRTPLQADDARTHQYVQDPTLVHALSLVFEQAWSNRGTLAFDPDRGVYDDRMPPLQQRDLVVYRELMTGATLDSIAHTVKMSRSTVQRTLRTLYALAGVDDRAQFVAFATKHWN
ncbi:hypothetical protein [Nonomuraea sp. bgisy101]|uniref:hypothetical protein n=1 Tax=Nonomuraea sp. bgisy101 TaxID=3413784 RepID=UPI003D759EB6